MSADPNQSHHSWRWISSIAILLYLALSLVTAFTREPFCDEAWFNSPALNLASKGYMGTSYLDPAGNIGKSQVRLDGINRYTYWMPPLYMVEQAAWIKIVGFGLLRVRFASVMWGLVALLAWWIVVDRLAGRLTGSVAILLLGVDYNWVFSAADARMEMLCAALGMTGLAAYLVYREHNFTRALLLANSAIAAAALTHPMGVLYGLAFAVMVLLADRSRLTWLHLPLSAAPHIVALAAWGAYIAQAPRLFVIQFTGNATGRGPGITQPWAALKLELTHRYAESFGMAPWTSPAARVKILVLLVYVAGLVWVTASRRLRERPGVKLAWGAAVAVLVFCWLLEASKSPIYLPHVLPWLSLLAAIAICDLGSAHPRTAILLVAAVVGIQVLSASLPARRNPYHHLFDPAMAFLAQHSQPQDTIMADSAIGWALGFDRGIVDDAWLGYKTGKKTDWLVITPVYAGSIESLPKTHSDAYTYVMKLLDQYRLAYENEDYRVYVNKTSPAASR